MGLKETLTADMKDAMRARQADRLTTIRMLLSEVKNLEIRNKGPLSEDDELQFLATQAKRRRESIKAFDDGGRDELAEQERTELAVIETYLPEPLDAEAVREMAAEIVATLDNPSMQDMGAVMGQLMPRLKGRFPGNDVRPIVQALLS